MQIRGSNVMNRSQQAHTLVKQEMQLMTNAMTGPQVAQLSRRAANSAVWSTVLLESVAADPELAGKRRSEKAQALLRGKVGSRPEEGEVEVGLSVAPLPTRYLAGQEHVVALGGYVGAQLMGGPMIGGFTVQSRPLVCVGLVQPSLLPMCLCLPPFSFIFCSLDFRHLDDSEQPMQLEAGIEVGALLYALIAVL